MLGMQLFIQFLNQIILCNHFNISFSYLYKKVKFMLLQEMEIQLSSDSGNSIKQDNFNNSLKTSQFTVSVSALFYSIEH